MPRSPSSPLAWAEEVSRPALLKASKKSLTKLSSELGLGLSEEELRRLQGHYRALRREPTDVELAGIAQSWSEHCSYKSSKLWLREAFRGLAPRPKVLGTGDAGVLGFDRTYAYALRIESHNHPSAVEPYGGAATGTGGYCATCSPWAASRSPLPIRSSSVLRTAPPPRMDTSRRGLWPAG